MADLFFQIIGSPEFAAFILTAFTAVVGAVVGWLALQFRKHILGKLSDQELAFIQQIAMIVVRYVEQTQIGKDSKEKLQAAVDAANGILAGYGIKIRVEQLIAIIEAAVYAELGGTIPPTLAYYDNGPSVFADLPSGTGDFPGMQAGSY